MRAAGRVHEGDIGSIMSEIRVLSAPHFDKLAHILATAYPGFKILAAADRERFQERVRQLHEEDPTATFYGLFREGELLGTMCLYDFVMNFLGVHMPAGGIGQLAVDLMHKKEHAAKELMLYALRHFRSRQMPIVILYPFRPDFYRRMNFGYGPKMSQYRVKPAAFAKDSSKAHIRYLGSDDRQAIVDCYQRFARQTHGMIDKTEREMRNLFANEQKQVVGYEWQGAIRGYLVYTFEHGDTFLTNDLHIHEWIYETPEALSELMAFLRSQADQIRDVVVETHDEGFHHLFDDPRNGTGNLIPSVYHETNTQGVGLMYRLVDVAGIFDQLAQHDFGGQTCTLKLMVEDSFLPENAGSTLLRFDGGRMQRQAQGSADLEVRLAIEDLSSLLAGTVTIRALYNYGLAEISDPSHVERLSRLFAVEQQPACSTSF
jgi:predicted acetyltransferase